jgi:hypothetical protein
MLRSENKIILGKENSMKTKLMLAMTLVAAVVLVSGCSSPQPTTGFLSDYSKLVKESDTVMRYVDESAVGQYNQFIVEPVTVRYYEGSKAKDKLSEKQTAELTAYTQEQIMEAIHAAGKQVAYQPGPGVAKIRVALTDITKTGAINILPQASLLGAGIGGASMEGEAVDSVTGKQIGAVVQSGKGGRIPFTNLGDITASKNVIKEWADTFEKRLEGKK